MKDLFLYVGRYDVPYKIPYIFKTELLFAENIQIQPIEKIQNFFNTFITKVITSGTTKGNINNTIIISSFNDNLNDNYFIIVHFFNNNFMVF